MSSDYRSDDVPSYSRDQTEEMAEQGHLAMPATSGEMYAASRQSGRGACVQNRAAAGSEY